MTLISRMRGRQCILIPFAVPHDASCSTRRQVLLVVNNGRGVPRQQHHPSLVRQGTSCEVSFFALDRLSPQHTGWRPKNLIPSFMYRIRRRPNLYWYCFWSLFAHRDRKIHVQAGIGSRPAAFNTLPCQRVSDIQKRASTQCCCARSREASSVSLRVLTFIRLSWPATAFCSWIGLSRFLVLCQIGLKTNMRLQVKPRLRPYLAL